MEETTELTLGDALVLYTDGIAEAHHDHELFGEERLVATLASRAGRTAEDMADAVTGAVKAFARGPRRDDQALLLLSVEDPLV